MATVIIQATAICSGGNHVTISASFNGGAAQSATFGVDDLLAALGAVDRRDVMLALTRVHAIGKTGAQLKSDLQAGLTLTI